MSSVGTGCAQLPRQTEPAKAAAQLGESKSENSVTSSPAKPTPVSRPALKGDISKISSDEDRLKAWQANWQSVRELKGSVLELYYLILDEGLEKEKSTKVLRPLLEILYGATDTSLSVLQLLPRETDQEKAEYQDLLSNVEDALWRRLVHGLGDGHNKLILFDSFVRIAETKMAMDHLKDVLDGRTKIAGLSMDQKKRWQIVRQLARGNFKEVEGVIEKEEKRDSSATGKIEAQRARASLPDLQRKTAMILELKKDEFDEDARPAMIESLFPRNQAELRDEYGKRFFTDLLDVQNRSFARTFAELSPLECSEKNAGLISTFLKANSVQKPIQDFLEARATEGVLCRAILAIAREGYSPPEKPQDPPKRKKRHKRHHKKPVA